MALQENTFEIQIVVKHGTRQYIKHRKYKKEDNNGCNHINNIACTADNIGCEIIKEIEKYE